MVTVTLLIEQYYDDVNHILLLSYYIFVMSTCRCSVFLLERPWMTIISGPQTHCLDQKSKYNTTVLQWSEVFYSVVWCGVVQCSEVFCFVVECFVLYCIVLYCIALYCIVLYCIALYCIVFQCIVLRCIVLYSSVVLCGYVFIPAVSCDTFSTVVGYVILLFAVWCVQFHILTLKDSLERFQILGPRSYISYAISI